MDLLGNRNIIIAYIISSTSNMAIIEIMISFKRAIPIFVLLSILLSIFSVVLLIHILTGMSFKDQFTIAENKYIRAPETEWESNGFIQLSAYIYFMLFAIVGVILHSFMKINNIILGFYIYSGLGIILNFLISIGEIFSYKFLKFLYKNR